MNHVQTRKSHIDSPPPPSMAVVLAYRQEMEKLAAESALAQALTTDQISILSDYDLHNRLTQQDVTVPQSVLDAMAAANVRRHQALTRGTRSVGVLSAAQPPPTPPTPPTPAPPPTTQTVALSGLLAPMTTTHTSPTTVDPSSVPVASSSTASEAADAKSVFPAAAPLSANPVALPSSSQNSLMMPASVSTLPTISTPPPPPPPSFVATPSSLDPHYTHVPMPHTRPTPPAGAPAAVRGAITPNMTPSEQWAVLHERYRAEVKRYSQQLIVARDMQAGHHKPQIVKEYDECVRRTHRYLSELCEQLNRVVGQLATENERLRRFEDERIFKPQLGDAMLYSKLQNEREVRQKQLLDIQQMFLQQQKNNQTIA